MAGRSRWPAARTRRRSGRQFMKSAPRAGRRARQGPLQDREAEEDDAVRGARPRSRGRGHDAAREASPGVGGAHPPIRPAPRAVAPATARTPRHETTATATPGRRRRGHRRRHRWKHGRGGGGGGGQTPAPDPAPAPTPAPAPLPRLAPAPWRGARRRRDPLNRLTPPGWPRPGDVAVSSDGEPPRQLRRLRDPDPRSGDDRRPLPPGRGRAEEDRSADHVARVQVRVDPQRLTELARPGAEVERRAPVARGAPASPRGPRWAPAPG